MRFANLYGPFSAHKNSVVAKFIKDIVATGKITIDGSGAQTRDMIYVEDLCQAVQLALASDVNGEVFQIATGVETSIRQLAEIIREVMGRQVELVDAPARQGDIDKNYSAIAKARALLGWEPQVTLNEGLLRTWEWFSNDSL